VLLNNKTKAILRDLAVLNKIFIRTTCIKLHFLYCWWLDFSFLPFEVFLCQEKLDNNVNLISDKLILDF